MTSTLRVNAANTARTKPTTGDTKMSFVNTDHLGWLMCDGRAMDKTADNLLFQVIGYTFGGSGNSFNLPNPAGRVMGTVGTVTDANTPAIVRTYVKGQSVGELDHKLTIGEMPAHNHNDATDSPGANTIVDGTTSSYTHGHGNVTGDASSSTGSIKVLEAGLGLGTNVATSSGLHSHSISNDTHSHTISSNGNNEYHNNIQPTLFYGNTFIYCGVPMRGEFPFKTGLAPVLI
jgi:microcystin-dependent protein